MKRGWAAKESSEAQAAAHVAEAMKMLYADKLVIGREIFRPHQLKLQAHLTMCVTSYTTCATR